MDQNSIYQKLTDIFRGVFDDDSIVLTPTTTAKDIKDWDSVNHIHIIIATEAAFGIKFKSAEIGELADVGELVKTIGRKLSP